MAVVQISKIQVRRGRKSQTNIPQLSGGEMGWAVDTQQLYIGNGSVSEGAPFVGNTEILTENSNIFGLLGAYTFGDGSVQTGADSNTPFSRSLQQKLDDNVSVKDFGAVGDYANGVGTDDTLALQRAIDQLYLNTANKTSETSHRTLFIPAGIYKITNTLYIPANAVLVGDGGDNTIIYQDANDKSVFQTIASSSLPGSYVKFDVMTADIIPRNVSITGITFKRNQGSTTPTPIAMLDCLANSVFDSCTFVGNWANGQGEERGLVLPGSNSALHVRGKGATTTEDVLFINCEFRFVAHALYADYDSNRISFQNCTFKNLYRALTLGRASTQSVGQNIGPQRFVVESSIFDNIDAEAIRVYSNVPSKGHRSVNNRYFDVGNNNLGQSQPARPVLTFENDNCESVGDWFQRNIDVNLVDLNKSTLSANFVAYVPDVLGVSKVEYGSKTATLLSGTPITTPKVLCKAPLWTTSKITVDYTIKKASTGLYRSGKLTISAHPSMSGSNSIVPVLEDDFIYHGEDATIGTSVGGNILFYVSVIDMTAIYYDPTTLASNVVGRPTLVLRYANPSGPGGNAEISYSVTTNNGSKDYVETY